MECRLSFFLVIEPPLVCLVWRYNILFEVCGIIRNIFTPAKSKKREQSVIEIFMNSREKLETKLTSNNFL